MSSRNETLIQEAIEASQQPGNTITLYKLCQTKGLCYKTALRRLQGTPSRQQYNIELRLLSPIQESILEEQIIHLAKVKCCPSGKKVRRLAADIIRKDFPDAPVPSRTWFTGFLKRSKYLQRKKNGPIDFTMIQENGESLIRFFFERLAYFEDILEVTPDRVWNLDECGFKIGEMDARSWCLAPNGYRNDASYDSSELCTVIEAISATGELLTPLLIYKGNYVMKNWIPETREADSLECTSSTAFINSELFYDWFRKCFPAKEEWQILIMDGCSSQCNDKLYSLALDKNVLPIFLPSKMSNILQPLDRAPFGKSKIFYKDSVEDKFSVELTPEMRSFFGTYDRMRQRVFTKQVIKKSWQRTGIFPRDIPCAVNEFLRQMNRTPIEIPLNSLSGIELPFSEENVDPGNAATPETEPEVVVTPKKRSWRSYCTSSAAIRKKHLEVIRDLKSQLTTSHAKMRSQEDEIAYLKKCLSETSKNNPLKDSD